MLLEQGAPVILGQGKRGRLLSISNCMTFIIVNNSALTSVFASLFSFSDTLLEISVFLVDFIFLFNSIGSVDWMNYISLVFLIGVVFLVGLVFVRLY